MTALHWAHLVVKPKGSLQLFFWYQSTRQTNVAGCSRHLIRHAGCLFLLVGLLSTNSLCALWISVHLCCMILHSWERLGSFFLVCLFPSLFSSLYSIYIFSLFSLLSLFYLDPSWSVLVRLWSLEVWQVLQVSKASQELHAHHAPSLGVPSVPTEGAFTYLHHVCALEGGCRLPGCPHGMC